MHSQRPHSAMLGRAPTPTWRQYQVTPEHAKRAPATTAMHWEMFASVFPGMARAHPRCGKPPTVSANASCARSTSDAFRAPRPSLAWYTRDKAGCVCAFAARRSATWSQTRPRSTSWRLSSPTEARENLAAQPATQTFPAQSRVHSHGRRSAERGVYRSVGYLPGARNSSLCVDVMGDEPCPVYCVHGTVVSKPPR